MLLMPSIDSFQLLMFFDFCFLFFSRTCKCFASSNCCFTQDLNAEDAFGRRSLHRVNLANLAF